MAATCVIMLCGCAPLAQNLNARNASAHESAARIAARDGDWDTARRQYAQALTNARLAHAGAAEEGRLSYEYGRVLGITCDYGPAEEMLQSSRQLARQAGGPEYLPLLELALLAEKQHPQQALTYFNQLAPYLDNSQLAAGHPKGVADVRRRYASVLAANGDEDGATAQRTKAAALEAAHPGASEAGGFTPYGSACTAGQQAK
jgi:tetratricopeptide (TPR) repeat protein